MLQHQRRDRIIPGIFMPKNTIAISQKGNDIMATAKNYHQANTDASSMLEQKMEKGNISLLLPTPKRKPSGKH